ncbi:helix-turn-helix transcriptional regulator [Muricauda sp. SCSIO 64092]|uniref:helix-turn-helix domain-containing protein n=1 Tax=Allomuricauda sp. SCSIO 64092 TaxID=2908842 RepID=UPI001FF41579|nr:helix-turn-helix transcriptional regulator [Muricauda sp. SCSIO 64092]UOY09220.1 helix-turn-helix transcriptional regulator [Muricauda sp. SCSIO 64092]
MRYSDPEVFYKKLGNKIRELRKERKWSQSDLGYKSELDKSAIQRIERGVDNSTIRTLIKIANGFDIEFKGLFDFPKDDLEK